MIDSYSNYISTPSTVQVNNLTIGHALSLGLSLFINTLTVDGTLRIQSGGTVSAPLFSVSPTINGAGQIEVDSGGTLTAFIGPSGQERAISVAIPITNQGNVYVNTGSKLNGGIDNYSHLTLWGNIRGTIAGKIVNEVGATIVVGSGGSPNYSYGPRVSIAPGSTITNRGTVLVGQSVIPNPPTTLSIDNWDVYKDPGLTVSFPPNTVLGGTWATGYRSLRFINSENLSFDSTFSFVSGTLILENVTATLPAFQPTVGLELRGSTQAIFAQPRSSLALLRIKDNATATIAQGNGVLRAVDFEVLGSGTLNIEDGLFVHGNVPAFMRSFVTNPVPAITPPYAASISGTFNGSPITLEPNGNSHAVGYSRGDGLAVHYPSHVFNGETFDDNDFVFFTTLRGDANFDRQVDFTDLLTLSQHYGQATSRGYAEGNFEGNVTGSGTVGFEDLLRLAQNYGTPFVQARGMSSSRTECSGVLSLL